MEERCLLADKFILGRDRFAAGRWYAATTAHRTRTLPAPESLGFPPFVVLSLAACVFSLTVIALDNLTPDPPLDFSISTDLVTIANRICFLCAGAILSDVNDAGSITSWASGVTGLPRGAGFLWLAAALPLGILLLLLVSAPCTRNYDAD